MTSAGLPRPLARLRSAGRFAGQRLTDPLESLAQRVAERVVGLRRSAAGVTIRCG